MHWVRIWASGNYVNSKNDDVEESFELFEHEVPSDEQLKDYAVEFAESTCRFGDLERGYKCGHEVLPEVLPEDTRLRLIEIYKDRLEGAKRGLAYAQRILKSLKHKPPPVTKTRFKRKDPV